MSIESIVNHILDGARSEGERIIEQAKREKAKIISQAQKEATALYQDIIKREKRHQEAEHQRLIVAARLENKKKLLEAKQELIDSVFKKIKSASRSDKFKKQQVSQEGLKTVAEDIDFYLNNLRLECESQIAKILFG